MDLRPLESGSQVRSDIVDWDAPDDPQKPMNWSNLRKWAVVVTTSILLLVVSFSSSVFSASILDAADEYDVSSKVMLLGISLYVLGLAIGPIVWGPASELWGRLMPIWIGYVAFLILQIPLGVAQDVPTILVVRFLAGLFGSAPLAIIPGMCVDYLGPIDRGIATAIFSAGSFCGPALGPIIGNLVTVNLNWRWTAWITLIPGVFFGLLTFLCTPESSEPILLKRKAQKLRLETGEWALHAKCEEKPADLQYFVEKYLTKPVKMLFLEPILMILTLYMSLVYGLLYLALTLYPYAFYEKRGWSRVNSSLPFLTLLFGVMIGCFLIGLHSHLHGKRIQRGRKLTPEDRLPPAVLGSVMLPIGLFIFSWTSDPDTSFLPQVISGLLIGCSIVLVFMSSFAFLVETYLFDANSALAINALLRSLVAAAFPLISPQMFKLLDIDWSGSLLGIICIVLAPFPAIMLKYGCKVRSWSRFASAL